MTLTVITPLRLDLRVADLWRPALDALERAERELSRAMQERVFHFCGENHHRVTDANAKFAALESLRLLRFFRHHPLHDVTVS